MKTYISIILTIVGISLSLPGYSKEKTDYYLSKFDFLLNHNLLFDGEIDNDSIILWEKRLEPVLKEREDYVMLFRLKQLASYAYAMRGDVNMAVEYSRQMYEEAKAMDFKIGIALAYGAIGDAYLNSNMPAEALGAYEEACHLTQEIPDIDNIKANMMPRYILSLLQTNRIDEAAMCIQRLDKLTESVPQQLVDFMSPLVHANYETLANNPKKAFGYLEQAREVVDKTNFEYHRTLFQQALAAHYEQIGNYKKALELYSELEQKTKKHSAQSMQFALSRARLLDRIGNTNEACLAYQKVHTLQDSICAKSYARQINEMRVLYYVDQIELENQAERNRLLLGSIIGFLCLLGLIIFIALRIRRQNKQLLNSQKRLEVAKTNAENAIRTKSMFLSNMSHEIRTPLNALSGFSAILTEQNIDNDTRMQCNDIIQQNSELLLKLINDVIDLSNLELGKLEFTIEDCDAISICRNVIDTVERVKQTSTAVLFKTELSSLKLHSDSSRLQQVLINLLINATKFTPQGSITLEVTKESNTTALFTVTDTGFGIPLEKQDKIFNRFEKLNEGAQGTGLGLSICQLIIERLGGEIWIDPSYTEGARFVFTHPIDNVAADRKEEQA